MARNRHGGGPREYHKEGVPKRFWHFEAVVAEMAPLLDSKPCVMAEIGVYLAHFSWSMLNRFPLLKTILVDPYPMDTSVWPKSLARSKLDFDPKNMTLIKEAAIERMREFADDGRAAWKFEESHVAATSVLDRTLDFAFIDASHAYDDCKRDLVSWWPKIRPGGVLSGHDYVLHRSSRHRWGVTRAVHEFAEETGSPLITGDGKTYFFRKQ